MIENFKQLIETRPDESFRRVATCTPVIELGDVGFNVQQIIGMIEQAEKEKVDVVVFPELSLTGYTIKDFHNNQKILDDTEKGLLAISDYTAHSGVSVVVGAAINWRGATYNTGVVIAGGAIKGVVPKSFLPNYREFEEKRWFNSGEGLGNEVISIAGQTAPFGTNILFNQEGMLFGVEICEDLWAPNPPSNQLSIAGADLIVNLSASNELVGKARYRRDLVCNQAARCMVAYVYCSSGIHESTADLVFSGHNIISERGSVLAEGERFSVENQMTVADVDLDAIQHDRSINSNFRAKVKQGGYLVVDIKKRSSTPSDLLRSIDKHPFVPSDPELKNEVAEEVFNIQAHGLATTLRKAGIDKVVLGLSGGLDSTLALLVAIKAMDILGYDASHVHTITMPGFASSDRTQGNASQLAGALGTTHQELPINSIASEMMSLLGHDGDQDVAYENIQARMRTSVLFNRSNQIGGLVLGTGDLSEIALGWCTFNGDQMSNYNVNASVPKTLVRYLIEWACRQRIFSGASGLLADILDTPISPELVSAQNEEIDQVTEDIIGPYELHDFFLHRLLRYSEAPAKIGYMAIKAFEEEYTPDDIAKWLIVFMTRFTQNQHKRESMPDGPKVGSISLSQRGDHRMPPGMSLGWVC